VSTLRLVLANLTFANQLTFLRLVAIPLLLIFLLQGRNGLALALFIGAAVTDLLDGLVARWLRQQSALGTFLDPAADKLLMLGCYVTLALPPTMPTFPDFRPANPVPIWLAILVVARDSFIVVTALVLYLTLGAKRFPPTRLGKWCTGAELATVGVFLVYNWAGIASHLWVPFCVWVTLALVVSSGVHYILITRRVVTELHGPPPARREP
jgi:cardiolipin synthase